MTDRPSSLINITQSVLPRFFGEKDQADCLQSPPFPTDEFQDNLTFSREIEQFGVALESLYDPLTAKGLLIRIGRETFLHVRRKFEKISCLGEINNRLKPIHKRFADSFQELTEWITIEMFVEIQVKSEEENQFRLILNIGNSSFLYFPYFLIGILEEFCYWLDTRKNYNLAYLEKIPLASGEILVIIKDFA